MSLHRALGNDPIDKKGRFHDNGLEPDEHVLTLVFPASGNTKMRSAKEIDQLAKQQFIMLRLVTKMLASGIP